MDKPHCLHCKPPSSQAHVDFPSESPPTIWFSTVKNLSLFIKSWAQTCKAVTGEEESLHGGPDNRSFQVTDLQVQLGSLLQSFLLTQEDIERQGNQFYYNVKVFMIKLFSGVGGLAFAWLVKSLGINEKGVPHVFNMDCRPHLEHPIPPMYAVRKLQKHKFCLVKMG
ncbi:hypothetical protein FNV43_RR08562 [Rhamnella rubrinervis]|uniref:Uncharacterized protein n=1 Tax=Rhamnella rubrinervis TaxID=2594499 RepID=A0A8K0H8H0_9ROSA|nr:hypothetical protein FNV43_RR08373 [Rhamnella rubrinervis]KAF3447856.1 hypothetical protein FNV43_RR08562 [Rhamnella rubrinervis]